MGDKHRYKVLGSTYLSRESFAEAKRAYDKAKKWADDEAKEKQKKKPRDYEKFERAQNKRMWATYTALLRRMGAERPKPGGGRSHEASKS
jgi:hypothetical protein